MSAASKLLFMPLERDTVGAGGNASNASNETDALLKGTWQSAANTDSFASIAGMAARARAMISATKSFADTTYEANGHVLEPLTDTQDLDSAQLRAQGHEAALERDFSPLAALGLGFRYMFMFLTTTLSRIRSNCPASQTLG